MERKLEEGKGRKEQRAKGKMKKKFGGREGEGREEGEAEI